MQTENSETERTLEIVPAGDAPEAWSPPQVEPIDHTFEGEDGVVLHYLEWPGPADAPVLLMVHGRRAHAHWFDPVVEPLRGRYRCMALDLRGHGDSGAAGGGTFALYTADFARWMDLFEGQRVGILAHSMAGRIALLCHTRHGVRPEILVLADTPIRSFPHHLRPEKRFRPKFYPDLETAISRFRVMPGGCVGSRDLLDYIARKSLKQVEDGSWTWRFDEEGSSRPFGEDFPQLEDLGVEQIKCPTLVIYGSESVLFNRDEAIMMGELLERPTLVELEDAHHHLMFDRPLAFGDQLLKFYEAHEFAG